MAHNGQSRTSQHNMESMRPSYEPSDRNKKTANKRKSSQADGRPKTRPFADRNRSDNHNGNQSGPSLLESPNGGVTINDGQFNATAGSHISVTINAGDSQSASSPPPPPKAKRGRRKRPSNDVPVCHSCAALVTQYQPSRKSCETYYLNLATEGRGSPLWIPGPNQRLSIAYRLLGVRCGDVGIITSQGSFDFLFNIFLPKEHPINSKGVPEGFVPLDAEQLELQEYSAFGRDSFLASKSIRKNNRNNSNELSFEVSASEGAVLAMPEGSVSEDVGNTARLRKYAKQNAESWYKHIICERGREVRNGDVRLVTGYDNTSVWGMAAFANPTEEGRPQDLRFAASGDSNNGNEYFWDYSGTAETKTGPGEREIEALRTMASAPEGTRYQNQSLFIRTLNITFQEDVWQQLKADCDYEDGDEDENGSSDSGSFSSADSCFSRAFNPSSSSSRSQPNGRQGSNSSAGNSRRRAYAMDTQMDTFGAGGALTIHPSSILNDYILRSAPSAKMAITSDEDWMCLMKESDNTLPSADEICDRIRQSFEICEDDETVILSAKSSSVQSCPSRTSSDLSEIAGPSKLYSSPNMTSYLYTKPDYDSYEIPFNTPPLINTSPPDFQIHHSYVEESSLNPYPYWTADSDDSASHFLYPYCPPLKFYDNHLRYGTTGVLADYRYPQDSLPISPSTETGNEHVAQPTNPLDPYPRHLRPPRPVPPRNVNEGSWTDAVFDQREIIDMPVKRRLPDKRLLATQRVIQTFKDWKDFDFEYLYARTFGTQDETGPQSPFSAEIRGHEQLSAPALPHLKRSVPLRQLAGQAGYQGIGNGSSSATPPHLPSMSVTPPRLSAGGWSSSPSSSWPSPTTLLCYPTEVLLNGQTHGAVIPPPLVVPPFDHYSLHSDSTSVQTTLSNATDDHCISSRKCIDGSSSHREDITGEPSMLQEAQCLYLPRYLRSSTREEGTRASLEPLPGTLLESSFL